MCYSRQAIPPPVPNRPGGTTNRGPPPYHLAQMFSHQFVLLRTPVNLEKIGWQVNHCAHQAVLTL